jgi:hypothetical protein
MRARRRRSYQQGRTRHVHGRAISSPPSLHAFPNLVSCLTSSFPSFIPSFPPLPFPSLLSFQVEPYRVACPNHIDKVPGVDLGSSPFDSEWDEEGEEEQGFAEPSGADRAGDMLRQ